MEDLIKDPPTSLDIDVSFIESLRFEPGFDNYTDFDLLVMRDDLFEVFFEYGLDYSVDYSRLRALVNEFGLIDDRALKHFIMAAEGTYG